MKIYVPYGLKQEYEKTIMNNYPEDWAKALEDGRLEVVELEKVVVSPLQKIRNRFKRLFWKFQDWREK